jgi:ribosomal protein L32
MKIMYKTSKSKKAENKEITNKKVIKAFNVLENCGYKD